MALRADLDHGLDSRWSQVLYVESSQLTDEPTVTCESRLSPRWRMNQTFFGVKRAQNSPIPPPQSYIHLLCEWQESKCIRVEKGDSST